MLLLSNNIGSNLRCTLQVSVPKARASLEVLPSVGPVTGQDYTREFAPFAVLGEGATHRAPPGTAAVSLSLFSTPAHAPQNARSHSEKDAQR
ncbi:MAG: hypothetical protein RIR73_1000 [Chloroflexota bacterium]